ncbi:probable helicase protein [Lentisphaera araneosa HTCC2155]|uniref:DNA 5'-3' helicase n=1 Tax=Lentisphaera araneosa HTCC2155 TaxID=313628 RepID=A6DK60_9BACT|nr:ATP-dependent DNA helicase [Lentisphaera araneosa]EDM27758.1 probable helicase protein [Lentisphaera araneosa HTCC2155]
MSAGSKLKLSVRELVDFAARKGDLVQTYQKTPTHLEGIKGHQYVQSLRSENWDKELTLKHDFQFQSYLVTLHGRADLVDQANFTLEEIKTTYTHDIPQHKFSCDLAQAKVYAYMLWQDREEITAVVNYYHLGESSENKRFHSFSSAELLNDINQYLKIYLEFYSKYQKCEKAYLEELKSAPFPHAEFRPSQRGIAKEVYRNIRDGKLLMFEAPTGTGKSLSTLFPASKALGEKQSRQILYLSAKTAAQQSALDALKQITKDSFSCLQISAREKVSTSSQEEIKKDYFERLPRARLAALEIGFLDQHELNKIAQQYHVCPFQLSLEMIPWQKIIIADFNYFFDPMVSFDYFENSKIDLLLDEGHNLLERARSMYSVSLDTAYLEKIRKLLKTKKAKSACRKIIVSIQKKFDELSMGQHLSTFEFVPDLIRSFLESCAQEFENDQQSLPGLESKDEVQNELKELYRFLKIYDFSTQEDIFYVDKYHLSRNPKLKLHLYCSQVHRHLVSKWKKLNSLCLFSATLSPEFYFQQCLALEQAKFYKLPPVFPRENQLTLALDYIDTRWLNRHSSLEILCGSILEIYKAYPGKHIVYFPSYQYLEMAKEVLYNQVPCIYQERSQESREKFLNGFFNDKNPVLGLAILGGVFAEGIDFKGEALKSCVIIGTGMPQPSFRMEQLNRCLSNDGLDAFLYNFLIPGITRLIQTAGRLIRTESDKGILVLIDPRFKQQQYLQYLPQSWQLNHINSPDQSLKLIQEFKKNEES